jgi:hypothetical protein
MFNIEKPESLFRVAECVEVFNKISKNFNFVI